MGAERVNHKQNLVLVCYSPPPKQVILTTLRSRKWRLCWQKVVWVRFRVISFLGEINDRYQQFSCSWQSLIESCWHIRGWFPRSFCVDHDQSFVSCSTIVFHCLSRRSWYIDCVLVTGPPILLKHCITSQWFQAFLSNVNSWSFLQPPRGKCFFWLLSSRWRCEWVRVRDRLEFWVGWEGGLHLASQCLAYSPVTPPNTPWGHQN